MVVPSVVVPTLKQWVYAAQYPRPMSPKESFKQEVGTFSVPVLQEDIGVYWKRGFLCFWVNFLGFHVFECAHINILSPYNFPSLLQRQQSVFDLKGPVDLWFSLRELYSLIPYFPIHSSRHHFSSWISQAFLLTIRILELKIEYGDAIWHILAMMTIFSNVEKTNNKDIFSNDWRNVFAKNPVFCD